MLNRRRTLYLLATIALLTFLFRLLFFAVYSPDYRYENMEIDAWLRIAERLVDGEGYSWLAPHIPTAKRGPVVVYFFAALLQNFGKQSMPIIIAQWLIDSITAVVLYFLTLKIFRQWYTALLAALLFAFYGPEIIFTFRAWSEPLFALLLCLFMLTLLYALDKPGWLLFTLTGILLGLVTLTRPYMQFFFIFIGFLLVWELRTRWRLIVGYFTVSFVSFVLVLTPWTIRNYFVFGAFIPASSYSGWPVFEGNHFLDQPDYNRSREHIESSVALMKVLEPDIGSTSDPARLFLYAARHGMSEYEIDQIALKEAVKAIARQPDRYLLVSGLRFMRLWFNIGYGTPSSAQTYMVLFVNVVLLILAVGAFLFFRGEWMRRSIPLAILVVFTTTVYSATQALVRYSVPVMPFIMIFAAFTITQLAHRYLGRVLPDTLLNKQQRL